MSKIHFIGDTHFGDANIIKYENRPFRFPEEMDEALIQSWNNNVASEDEIWILGDFGADGYEEEILSALNGTKYLIKGNHDIKSNDEYRNFGFKEVYDKPILYDDFFLLSHEPQYINISMPYVNVFAHVHGSPIYADHSRNHYCVSAERIGLAPVCYSAIKDKILEHRKIIIPKINKEM